MERIIKPNKLYTLIMEQITNMIEEENLGPGDRLPSERKIAEQLSVSRVSVRQAISVLVEKGLLDVRQGGGTYVAAHAKQPEIVKEISIQLANKQINPAHIAEVRMVIEPEIARLCALNADDDVCQKIGNLLERKRLTEGRGASYDEMNEDFHLAIAEGTGNPVYLIIMQNITELMKINMWRFGKQQSTKRLEVLNLHLDQHEALYGAITTHDADLAEKIMRQHIGCIESEMNKVFVE